MAKQSTKAKSTSPAIEKLSVVIPCYNEANRLDLLFQGVQQLVDKWDKPLEVILVNDGSSDNTVEAIQSHELFKQLEGRDIIHLVDLERNQGKGGALAAGVEAATGSHILTMDADMATPPLSIKKWDAKSDEWSHDVFIASRQHKASKVEDAPLRKVAGKIFNLCVRLFTPLRVRDSQCGYKLYPAELAKRLFDNLRIKGWAHDVEILTLAHYQGVTINERPVKWEARDESKISLLSDSLKMFFSILVIGLRMWGNHFITEPIRAIAGKRTPQIGKDGHPVFRLLFVLTALALLVLMPAVSSDFGITGDEWVQNDYGKQVYRYFTEGDKSAITPSAQKQGYEPIIYYSGGYELLNTAMYTWFGTNEWNTRHLINSLTGFLAILLCGLLARRLGGWRAGFLALIMLALFPRFFGHAMNNSKDIPFAAAYIFTVYFLFRWIQQMPRPAIKTLIFATIGIGLALNTRIGGLILLPYIAVFVGGEVVLNKSLRPQFMKLLPKMATWFVLVSGIAYILGVIFWPYALQNVFANPLEALRVMSDYVTNIRILFGGEYMMSGDVPWYYIPTWFAIGAPVVVLIGVLLGASLPVWTKFGKSRQFLLLVFVIVFPLVYAIYQGSNLYDGMRHFMFIVPPLIVLAALGWEHVLRKVKGKLPSIAAGVVVAVFVFLPLRWMVANHPFHTVYFNEISGGTGNNFGKYEMDYWMNSSKEATYWLIDELDLINNPDTLRIGTNTSYPVNRYLIGEGSVSRGKYMSFYERNLEPWDYGIFYTRYVDGDQLQNYWPPQGTIHVIEAGGAPINVIIKRVSTKDYEGYQAYQSGNYTKAISDFQEYVQLDTTSATVYFYLGMAQVNTKNFQGAIEALRHAVRIKPSDDNARFYLANSALNIQQPNIAIEQLTVLVEKNEEQWEQINDRLSTAMAKARKNPSDQQLQQDAGILNQQRQQTSEFLGQLYYSLAIAYSQTGNTQLQQQYLNKARQFNPNIQ